MSIESGQDLLHYRLVEKIGEGGMGVVWKALDTTLDRAVAIKLLPPTFADEPDRLARFEREAKLLAALNHANIASIFSVHQVPSDVSGEADQHFIALELVEGEELAARTAQGSLLLEDALQVCVEIAEALEAAHQAGVIHRDLKPANVKLAADGKVKVLDFGLAKAVDPVSSSDGMSPTFAPTVTSAGTRAGVILGTAAYMSPEQARGKPADQRADLWSFGCVLYECLTGLVLFRGETVSDSLAAVLRKEPDWSHLPPETPAGVRTLLRRCLTRDPARRVHSASDVRIELQEAIEHPEPEPGAGLQETIGAAGNRWLWIGAALLAGLALGWALKTWSGAGGSEPLVSHVSIPIPASLRMIKPPQLTPDGRTVVFKAMDLEDPLDERVYRLYSRSLDGGALSIVQGSDDADMFSLSPDGRSVAFVADPAGLARLQLFRVPLDQSTPPQLLTDWNSDHWTIVWLNDQEIVSIGADQKVHIFPSTGGAAKSVLELTGDSEPYLVSGRSALPDGRHILVRTVSFETGEYTQNVGVVDTTTGVLKHLVDRGSRPAFLPPNHLVFSRADQLMAAPFDMNSLEITGPAQPLMGGLWTEGGWTGGLFGVSARGDLAYYTGGIQGAQRQIVFQDREGNVTPWSDERHMFNVIIGSPDGRQLAAGVDNTATGDALLQIHVSSIDAPRLVTVGAVPGFDCSDPTWSTDSRYVAYTCVDQNSTVLFLVEPLVPGSEVRLAEWSAEIDIDIFGFARGDTHVLLKTTTENKREMVAAPVDTGKPVAVPMDDVEWRSAHATRDGRWMLYFSSDTGRRELLIRQILDGPSLGPRMPLGIDVGSWAFWGHGKGDGRYEMFFGKDGRVNTVVVATSPRLQLGTPESIAGDNVGLGLMYLEPLLDGRLLNIQRPDSENGSSEMRLIQNWRQELERRLSN